MAETVRDFKYDIAFSFLHQDEALAIRIGDLLQDRLKVFIYSKKQEELAGRDGEDAFSGVFAKECRVAVILYRDEWGRTPWTRMEMNAIRNRAFEEGYGFTLWVPLNDPPEIPAYVERTRLYANLHRFGEKSLAAVVEQLAKDRGAQATTESADEHAARIRRALVFEQERQTFLGLGDGVKRSQAEGLRIIDGIKDWAKGPGKDFRIEMREYPTGAALIYRTNRSPLTMLLNWRQNYANSQENAGLEVRLYSGIPQLPNNYIFEEPTELSSMKYWPDLLPSRDVGWALDQDRGNLQSTNEVTRSLIKIYSEKMISQVRG